MAPTPAPAARPAPAPAKPAPAPQRSHQPMNNGYPIYPETNPAMIRSMTPGAPGAGSMSTQRAYYHFQRFDAAGTTEMQFFHIPFQQMPNGKEDTNIVIGNRIPGAAFQIKLLEVVFISGAAVDVPGGVGEATDPMVARDVRAFYDYGRFELNVNGQLVMDEAPLRNLPPAYDYDMQGISWARPIGPVRFVTPIRLEAGHQFGAALFWKVARPLPSGLAARVGIRMVGIESTK